MTIPSNEDILRILIGLETKTADSLESQWLEFKPWRNPKEDMKVAVEQAVCFANGEGGCIVFGVADFVVGRDKAIYGAKGYDLDMWKKSIFESTRPNIVTEISEINVPEGTGKLLIVRVGKGLETPYGTSKGLFVKRVGKNCMPMDHKGFAKFKVSTGAIDWSGEPAVGVGYDDLDPLEIGRARNILKRVKQESELLKLDDRSFLSAIGAVKGGKVTNAGFLVFGHEKKLAELCPQHQVHYVHQISDINVARNDTYKLGMLNILERIEQIFTGPLNPEQEISVGLFKIRIPAFPLEVVREAILNAVTHRDYSDPNEVLIRHTMKELIITSPGGFIGGITLDNILRHEPVSRNKILAEIFEKLGLVERAGIGRRRIFITMLSYGKRIPKYETSGERVTLHIYDGGFDECMATLVAKWKQKGFEIDLDSLLILSYLKENPFINSSTAAALLQLQRESAKNVLDRFSDPKNGILERKGRTSAATYQLAKNVAKDLLGKAAYTKRKGLNPIRYAEIVRQYLLDHASITPAECREVLQLGDSQSARVEVSRYLRKWSSETGFLYEEGKPPGNKYFLKKQ